MDGRPDFIEIDRSSVRTAEELHRVLSAALGFPDFYGRNWAAFWDAITGLVELPRRLRFLGWAELENRLPSDTRSMRSLLDEMESQFPQWAAAVEYE